MVKYLETYGDFRKIKEKPGLIFIERRPSENSLIHRTDCRYVCMEIWAPDGRDLGHGKSWTKYSYHTDLQSVWNMLGRADDEALCAYCEPQEGFKRETEKAPDWLFRHDHLRNIPYTKSWVFYPYTIDEANEKKLNEHYKKYGYSVIIKPKAESEYQRTNTRGHEDAYKVLILEPNYDEQKINKGCDILAKRLHDYHFSHGELAYF